MERHQYKDVVFKGFPVLFVDSFNDLTQKLLEENEHLYQEALNMDMNKLDLGEIFKERTL